MREQYLREESGHILSSQPHQQNHTAQVGFLSADIHFGEGRALLGVRALQSIPICLQDPGHMVSLCIKLHVFVITGLCCLQMHDQTMESSAGSRSRIAAALHLAHHSAVPTHAGVVSVTRNKLCKAAAWESLLACLTHRAFVDDTHILSQQCRTRDRQTDRQTQTGS